MVVPVRPWYLKLGWNDQSSNHDVNEAAGLAGNPAKLTIHSYLPSSHLPNQFDHISEGYHDSNAAHLWHIGPCRSRLSLFAP